MIEQGSDSNVSRARSMLDSRRTSALFSPTKSVKRDARSVEVSTAMTRILSCSESFFILRGLVPITFLTDMTADVRAVF